MFVECPSARQQSGSLELRHVDDRRLLFRLLLFFLIEETIAVSIVPRPLFAGGQRRDNGRKHDYAVADERNSAEPMRPLVLYDPTRSGG